LRTSSVFNPPWYWRSAGLASVPAGAKQHDDNDETHYRAITWSRTSPASAGAGYQLVNGWGISYHNTFPFWVSDNGTGVTTL